MGFLPDLSAAFGLCTALLCSACGAPEPPESTGGTSVLPGACGRGMVVLSSDYQSSNVSLVSVDGAVLSDSFVSSATAAAGLSAPLSGDVTLSSSSYNDDEIVVIDRYPASVLTWVGVRDGAVREQLSVKTGFAANPKDYLRLADGRAYVSRFEPNLAAGQMPFDAGDDLLILQTKPAQIVGRVDLSSAMAGEAAEFFVRPSRMLQVAGRVLVLSQGYNNAGFSASASSRLIAVDPTTDSVVDVLPLHGAHGCLAMALSPDQKLLAVSCAGEFAGRENPDVQSSMIVLVDPVTFEERRRLRAVDHAGAPFGFGIGFVSPERIIVTAMGVVDASGNAALRDSVLSVAVDGSATSVILRSDDDAFVLGDVRCFAECGHCFVTDADRALLHQVSADRDGIVALKRSSRVGTSVGLPPRSLGAF